MVKKKKILKKKQGLQKRAQVTRDAILKASIRILEDLGMQSFNTNKIAEYTGISVGSLYQYFPNKESILEELVRNAIDQRVNNVKELLKKTTKEMSAKDVVSKLIEAAMETPETSPEVDQVLFELNHVILKNERIMRVDEHLLPIMKDYLKYYFPKSSKKNMELLLLVVISATRGVVTVSQAEGFKRFSKKEIKSELCKLAFRYLDQD